MQQPMWPYISSVIAYQIPQMVILVACVIYVVKTGRAAGYLMLAAQLGLVACALVRIAVICWYFGSAVERSAYQFVSMAGIVCVSAFAIGFVWLVLGVVKERGTNAGG
ncbi:MAG: hypothetical protein NTV22_13460 [bacterium]|nr:hypothetical protein [bacterium]